MSYDQPYAPQNPAFQPAGQPYPMAAYGPPVSQKSFVATWLLSWFLGFFGVDRFYLGKVGTGILKLLTLGGLGLWYLIDVILVLAGAARDKQGLPLAGYEENKKTAWIVSLILFVLSGISGGINAATNGGADVGALGAALGAVVGI